MVKCGCIAYSFRGRMNIFTLSVADIQKNHEEKVKKRINIYRKVLEKCFLNIKGCAESEKTYCFFTVPVIKFGEPLYKMRACIEYILFALKYRGYACKHIGSNIIYISWRITKPKYKALEYRRTSPQLRYRRSTPAVRTFPANRMPPPPTRSVYNYKPSGRFSG